VDECTVPMSCHLFGILRYGARLLVNAATDYYYYYYYYYGKIYRFVWVFRPRSSCTTHLMLFSERPPIYTSYAWRSRVKEPNNTL